MISPVLAQILRSGRDHFNARFLAARQAQPAIDGDGFLKFIADALDPLVQAVERVAPSAATDVALVGYDLALELHRLQLIGAGARHDHVRAVWQRVLPAAASAVAKTPGRLIAGACNAILQIAALPETRPEQWIAAMAAAGPACADAETWLTFGQVAAWRAGLAHYRVGALSAAATLPDALALAAVGGLTLASWTDVRDCLQADPWFDPAQPKALANRPQVARQTGSFRGFGGVFAEPPRVQLAGSHLLVSSGEDAWVLTADVFGATLHRATPAELALRETKPASAGDVRFTGTHLVVRGRGLDLPEFGEVTSAVVQGDTLAVTARMTYAVLLIVLPKS